MWERLAAGLRWVICHLPISYRTLRRRYATRPASRTGHDDTSGQRVYITFSTIPSRIEQLRPFLCGLYTQDYKADGIILNLPQHNLRENRAYTIPEYLVSDPNVTINVVERDWGPATKLIPLLTTMDPDTLLISVDDDNVYARGHIGNLARYCQRHPSHAAGHRGHMTGDFSKARKPATVGTRLDAPKAVDILAGCGSIAVRPRFFDESLTDYAQGPAGAFFVDDVWISGQLARRNIERVVPDFSASNVYLSALSTFRSIRLDRSENRTNENNLAAIEYFRDALGSDLHPDQGRATDVSRA